MKLIALTLREVRDESTGERRDAISRDWIRTLARKGYGTLLLPNHPASALALVAARRPAGILLTNGNDVAWGAARRVARAASTSPDRDRTEAALLRLAIRRAIPVLGVCRGAQMIQAYFGGALERLKKGSHVRVRHPVRLRDVAALGKYRGRSFRANSFHDLGIREPAPDLETMGSAPDGTTEILRHRRLPIWGILWHPERPGAPGGFDGFLLDRLFL